MDRQVTGLYALKRIAACMLLLLTVFALCACSLLEGIFPADTEDVSLEDPVDSDAGFRRTVLYFETDDGLMVPVMKLLPWEEGIGRAALNQLVDTDTNRVSAAAMGLKNVVPSGVSFVLSISDDAVATVDLIDLPALADAEAEQKLVTAVVNTLTEFSTIEKVQLRFDGKKVKKLAHGTRVDDVMATLPLNPEPLPVAASKDDPTCKLTLYFPNKAASLQIPVTRTVTGEPGIELAMRELVKGPADSALRGCFPEGTQVLSATAENGVCVVNLSKEFEELRDTPALEQTAVESMQLTARQYGASVLNLQVEGSDYAVDSVSTMAPVYVNEYR